MKGQPRRDWKDARVKCEHGCRVCAESWQVQAAHVIGRIHDRPKTERSKTLYVHPDSVVPMCRRCHGAYDRHELDLLPYLSLEEQLRAVEDAGGIELARMRTCPSQYSKAVAA